MKTSTAPADRLKTKSRLRWLSRLAWMLAGSVVTLIVLAGGFFLIFSSPTATSPFVNPIVGSRSDLAVRLSQEYVNREITTSLQKTPLSVFNNAASVSQVKLQFNPGSVLDVTARVNVLGRDFDFKIKDSLFAKGGKVGLKLLEDVKLQGLGLPLGILNGIVDEINNNVAAQLNAQIAATSTQTNGRIPTLTNVTLDSGILLAEFAIDIK